MCRRATGSAFAVLAWLPSTAIEWHGAPARRRSSPIAVREFCATCGTPLTLVYDDKPSETALHLGVFDNPEQYEPRYNYGVDQRLGWICTGVDLPGYRTKELVTSPLVRAAFVDCHAFSNPDPSNRLSAATTLDMDRCFRLRVPCSAREVAMGTDRHEKIQQRAHEIWEREGRPDGQHDRHWRQAIDELDRDELDRERQELADARKEETSPTGQERDQGHVETGDVLAEEALAIKTGISGDEAERLLEKSGGDSEAAEQAARAEAPDN
jgi:hypothetical protein